MWDKLLENKNRLSRGASLLPIKYRLQSPKLSLRLRKLDDRKLAHLTLKLTTFKPPFLTGRSNEFY